MFEVGPVPAGVMYKGKCSRRVRYKEVSVHGGLGTKVNSRAITYKSKRPRRVMYKGKCSRRVCTKVSVHGGLGTR